MSKAGIVSGVHTTCVLCGKQVYKNRKTARRAAKVLYPGHTMSAYQCEKGYWHIGHTPSAIVKGKRTR